MASPSSTDRVRLIPDEDHALNAAAFAAGDFEPFVGRMIDSVVLERVVEKGWVETGESCRPAVGQVGYRLTAMGWAKFKRKSF